MKQDRPPSPPRCWRRCLHPPRMRSCPPCLRLPRLTPGWSRRRARCQPTAGSARSQRGTLQAGQRWRRPPGRWPRLGRCKEPGRWTGPCRLALPRAARRQPVTGRPRLPPLRLPQSWPLPRSPPRIGGRRPREPPRPVPHPPPRCRHVPNRRQVRSPPASPGAAKEAARLLSLGTALLAINQVGEAKKLIKASADLGDRKAAALLAAYEAAALAPHVPPGPAPAEVRGKPAVRAVP